MVDLVADIVDIRREVVLGVVVDYVTDVREDQVLKYAVLQVFQKPAKSHSFFKPWRTNKSLTKL